MIHSKNQLYQLRIFFGTNASRNRADTNRCEFLLAPERYGWAENGYIYIAANIYVCEWGIIVTRSIFLSFYAARTPIHFTNELLLMFVPQI